jgi:hypothetical protein
LDGEVPVALALPAGKGAPPGVRAGRPPEVLSQRGECGDGGRGPVFGTGEMAVPLVGRAPGGAEALRAAGNEDERRL